MKLTRFTDYSLRVLTYLGLKDDEMVTIREIAAAYRISRNHLMKVVSNLTRLGYVKAQRGPGGGISLARHPSKINIAQVIRDMEEDMDLVECFSPNGNCTITSECRLRGILQQALRAYLATLEEYNLQDLLKPAVQLESLLGIEHRTA